MPISTAATAAAVTGVQRPASSSRPRTISRTSTEAGRETASVPTSPAMPRYTSTPPVTARMISSPAPGRPVANVEYSLRTGPSRRYRMGDGVGIPERVRASPLSSQLQLNDPALEADRRGVGAIARVQLRQDVLDAPLD